MTGVTILGKQCGKHQEKMQKLLKTDMSPTSASCGVQKNQSGRFRMLSSKKVTALHLEDVLPAPSLPNI